MRAYPLFPNRQEEITFVVHLHIKLIYDFLLQYDLELRPWLYRSAGVDRSESEAPKRSGGHRRQNQGRLLRCQGPRS